MGPKIWHFRGIPPLNHSKKIACAAFYEVTPFRLLHGKQYFSSLLGLLYLYALAPLLETLQRTMGDFVPPGEVLPTVSRGIVLFFIANVLLAPLVEETLYRGIALPVLGSALGVPWAVVLSCVFFGFLHWVGGFWYMLLTGVVAGGMFTGLYLWRGGILAPFAAHFALNLVEFAYAWRTRSDV